MRQRISSNMRTAKLSCLATHNKLENDNDFKIVCFWEVLVGFLIWHTHSFVIHWLIHSRNHSTESKESRTIFNPVDSVVIRMLPRNRRQLSVRRWAVAHFFVRKAVSFHCHHPVRIHGIHLTIVLSIFLWKIPKIQLAKPWTFPILRGFSKGWLEAWETWSHLRSSLGDDTNGAHDDDSNADDNDSGNRWNDDIQVHPFWKTRKHRVDFSVVLVFSASTKSSANFF